VRARVLIAVIALGFFWAPIALRMVGVTARPFENRRLAGFPKPSQGWEALDQSTRFFVDRLPLREQAVQANTWISERVFDTTPDYARNDPGGGDEHASLPFGQPEKAAPTPTPEAGAQPSGAPATSPNPPAAGQAAAGQPSSTVLKGRAGWLYLGDEAVRACSLFSPWKQALRRWERFMSILRRSGRRVILVIAPDKSTIYPEYLPETYTEKQCAPRGRRKNWAAIEGAAGRDPRILPLRRSLLAIKRPPPHEAYLRKDTHWNTVAGTLAVDKTLRRLGDVRMRTGDIIKGRARYTGDITNLVGAPETDVSPQWTIRRRGLPPTSSTRGKLPGGQPIRVLARPAGGPKVIPGRTLFLYDSYGFAMLGGLRSYTRTLDLVQWYGATGGISADSLTTALSRSRTIILETVERDVNFKASDQGFLTPAYLDRLATELPPERGR
jgi:hypothetical protein